MPIDYGLIFSQATSSAVPGVANTPIAVVGTATTGTAVNNRLYQVTNAADALTLFGTQAAGATIPRCLEVLQRYGCGNILVVRVAVGADAAATETNLIGGVDGVTGARTGLQLLRDSYSQLGFTPDIILTPTFSSAAVVTAALAVAASQRAIYIANFTANSLVADALAARATNTGLGTKDKRLIATFPHLKRSSDNTILETVSSHLAGVIARLDYDANYGRSPGNQLLRGVNATDINMSLSYTDEASDTERLADVGIVTVNRQQADLVSWGHRNGSFASQAQSGDLLTFINSVRVQDRVTNLLEYRAQKFLDLPSNRRTATLLEESFNSALSIEQSTGAIAALPGTGATFLEAQSDYPTGRLKYSISIAPFPPTRLIDITTYLTSFDVVINLGGVA